MHGRETPLKVYGNLKVQFSLNTPATHSLKYFCSKFREIITGGSREIQTVGVFPRKLFRIQSQILTHCACAQLNWVLTVTKKNLGSLHRFLLTVTL